VVVVLVTSAKVYRKEDRKSKVSEEKKILIGVAGACSEVRTCALVVRIVHHGDVRKIMAGPSDDAAFLPSIVEALPDFRRIGQPLGNATVRQSNKTSPYRNRHPP